tara:strand:- start:2350 stop:3237 length:888 start_codon:yes stop_codon:yes gene_type:complete
LRKIDIKKLSIGSAQLDTNYGLGSNSLTIYEFEKILEIANKMKINNLDTASDYLNSENIIGKLKISKRFKITTKLEKFDKIKKLEKKIDSLEKSIYFSLRNLKRKSIDSLLFHESKSLLKKNGDKIYKKLMDFKSNKIINKIGISIYNIKEFDCLIRNYDFDIVQIPLNVFNQNFFLNNNLKKIKKRKIKIEVRSVFLQGLIINNKWIEKYFFQIKNKIKQLDKLSDRYNLNRIELCLNFIANIKEIDKIIIGVNNLNHFNQIINSQYKKINLNDFKSLSIKDKKIIDPRNWKFN